MNIANRLKRLLAAPSQGVGRSVAAPGPKPMPGNGPRFAFADETLDLTGMAISRELRRLLAVPARLDCSDEAAQVAFWTAYPRHRFIKTLGWKARLLDIGAGSGGLAIWREWQPPRRMDIQMYGVDLQRGDHAKLYKEWEVANLDEGLPAFGGTKFDGFMASHLIEHVADPARLVAAIAAAANPGARLYFEWPNPMTKTLPRAADLVAECQYTIQTFNFFDDHTHLETPSREEVAALLTQHGFHVQESAETWLGQLAEEMIARGRDSDDMTCRQMGLWSSIGWSNYIVAQFR